MILIAEEILSSQWTNDSVSTQELKPSHDPASLWVIGSWVESLWLWQELFMGYLSPMFTATNTAESVNCQPQITMNCHFFRSPTATLKPIDFIWCLPGWKDNFTLTRMCPQYWFASNSITIKRLAKVFSISPEMLKHLLPEQSPVERTEQNE